MVEVFPIVYRQFGYRVPVDRVVRVIPENTALLQVDLDCKWEWEVFSVGFDDDIPEILLHPVLGDGEDYDHTKIVTVSLVEFFGWSIWSVEVKKDYISIALWKDAP